MTWAERAGAEPVLLLTTEPTGFTESGNVKAGDKAGEAVAFERLLSLLLVCPHSDPTKIAMYTHGRHASAGKLVISKR